MGPALTVGGLVRFDHSLSALRLPIPVTELAALGLRPAEGPADGAEVAGYDIHQLIAIRGGRQ